MKITKIKVSEGYTEKVHGNYKRSDITLSAELSKVEGENFPRVKEIVRALRKEARILVRTN